MQKSTEIGHFQEFVHLLPASFCEHFNLVRTQSFYEFVASIFDIGFKVDILTSCNPRFFEVHFVVLHISGNSKFNISPYLFVTLNLSYGLQREGILMFLKQEIKTVALYVMDICTLIIREY